ncbi:hypothetical protein IWX75_002610 [Arthrobacter sp. CAN_A6]
MEYERVQQDGNHNRARLGDPGVIAAHQETLFTGHGVLTSSQGWLWYSHPGTSKPGRGSPARRRRGSRCGEQLVTNR